LVSHPFFGLLLAQSRLESPAVVVARTGSRAAVLRRSEPTRFSSASADKVGGYPGAIRSERERAIKQVKNASAPSMYIARSAR
jgi:hypothetical protein